MGTSDLPHVLLVSEDTATMSVMCQSLASGRFRCTGAIGSTEAFAIGKQSRFDVALLDVSGLPAADGLTSHDGSETKSRI